MYISHAKGAKKSNHLVSFDEITIDDQCLNVLGFIITKRMFERPSGPASPAAPS